MELMKAGELVVVMVVRKAVLLVVMRELQWVDVKVECLVELTVGLMVAMTVARSAVRSAG